MLFASSIIVVMLWLLYDVSIRINNIIAGTIQYFQAQ
jgi:hypothetical protein